jgi:hypothetical protein
MRRRGKHPPCRPLRQHELEEAGIDGVEQGYLEHLLGLGRLFEAGDIPGALAHFERARKVAARSLDRELGTLALIAAARMTIYLGDVADGIAQLDEAMVSIEAGDLSPMATGDAYCTVIDACAELSDIVRCRSWTTSMRRWCDTQQELVLYRGHCFVHSAEVLVVLGRWREGVAEAQCACDRLAGPLPAVLGAATRLEGDLLRLLGRHAESEARYLRANELGHEPQPGLALLRLAQGNPAGAAAMIRRVVAQTEVPLFRARLLGPYVEILLAADEIDDAREASEELREIAAEIGSAPWPPGRSVPCSSRAATQSAPCRSCAERSRRSVSSAPCTTRRALVCSLPTRARRPATTTARRWRTTPRRERSRAFAPNPTHRPRATRQAAGLPAH